MILVLTLVALLAASLAGLVRWRAAILVIILISALEDPVRKLIPGAPGWMTLAPVPVFLAAMLSARARMPSWWAAFRRSFPVIAKRLFSLLILCVPAAVISVSYGPGSWQYTMLGVFSYSIIFLAIVMGFHFARNLESVRRLLVFYVTVHAVVLSGGVLQYLEWFPEWTLLGDKALGYEWIRWIPGYIIRLISGFYRSADVMGWHAATVCMIGMIMAFSETGKSRGFWIILSGWAVLGLILCGRRKMVYMIPIFLMTLIWIYFYVGRAARVLPMIGFLVIPAVSVYWVNDFLGEEGGQMHYYTSGNEGDTVWDRLSGQGFGATIETIEQAGFFGYGLGFVAPGSHHIGAPRPRVWQESGTSRVMADLGVPGFLGFLAVIAAIVNALWRITRAHLRARTPEGIFAAGLLSFFVSNLGSLAVSGQIMADSFIVIFLGLLVGIVLGFARKEFMPPEILVSRGGVAPATEYPAVAARSPV